MLGKHRIALIIATTITLAATGRALGASSNTQTVSNNGCVDSEVDSRILALQRQMASIEQQLQVRGAECREERIGNSIAVEVVHNDFNRTVFNIDLRQVRGAVQREHRSAILRRSDAGHRDQRW